MTTNPVPPGSEHDRARDAEASVLMKRGLKLFDSADPDALPEAVLCFEQALEIRKQLPIDSVPIFRYGLAACWLNRADALARIGDSMQLAVVFRSYDSGIALLRDLPFENDPRFPRRLAIGLHNRALAFHAQGPGFIADTLQGFSDTIALLESDRAAAIPDRIHLLAGACLNLANARVTQGTDESEAQARDAAHRAIALVSDREDADADAAEIGLKARYVLCQLIASRLSVAPPGDGAMPEAVHAATDAIDDGLEMIRGWEQRGETRFRQIAFDLFRFGARVYAAYQPRFLEEFIDDNANRALSSDAYVDDPNISAAIEEARVLLRQNR